MSFLLNFWGLSCLVIFGVNFWQKTWELFFWEILGHFWPYSQSFSGNMFYFRVLKQIQEEQKKRLSEDGMKKAGEEVAAAEEENDVETPEEISAEFLVPNVGRVKLIVAWMNKWQTYGCR